MKNSILILFTALILAACTTDYLDCPNGGVYHEHTWQLKSIYDDNGWYTDVCQNCGLERMWGGRITCTTQRGTIYLYRNPDTGKFSDYRIEYTDASGHLHSDAVPTKNLKGDIR